MKTTIISVLVFAMYAMNLVHAQAPGKFNYQGIARDNNGKSLSHQKLSLRILILPTADSTRPEYEEIQSVETNEFGLYSIHIGDGDRISGSLDKV